MLRYCLHPITTTTVTAIVIVNITIAIITATAMVVIAVIFILGEECKLCYRCTDLQFPKQELTPEWYFQTVITQNTPKIEVVRLVAGRSHYK